MIDEGADPASVTGDVDIVGPVCESMYCTVVSDVGEDGPAFHGRTALEGKAFVVAGIGEAFAPVTTVFESSEGTGLFSCEPSGSARVVVQHPLQKDGPPAGKVPDSLKQVRFPPAGRCPGVDR